MPPAEERDPHAPGPGSGPLTYGTYLRVPELLALQSPLSLPVVHDELLFIVVQQAQELWFKQVLHELRVVIALLDAPRLLEAVRLVQRATAILGVLGAEVAILETMPPREFARFRGVLSTSSGFESEQFREVELASGLADPTFLQLIAKHMDGPALHGRWPRTLGAAFRGALATVDANPVAALVAIYSTPESYPELFMLAEALSEYEVRFQEWRFHHVKLVERVIGDRAPGTAGSAGSGYLGRTLTYRFFPELWEARNQLTARGTAR
ncbi:MAG TPA: tryptophan 2,3-dioxygenase family protein [Chloroflexia bacterium]|nr:tryptophan 2,3-dioxygenase family protein [Chloroflexia bacterium]